MAAAAIAIAVSFAAGFGAPTDAFAQTKLVDAGEPAEFPPASYTGRQYVDSNGCVFIRAGIDGNVTWVPRVSRSRKTICGFTPSLARTQTAQATAAPAPKPAPQPTVIAAAKPAPVAAPQPKKVVRRVPTPGATAPAPAPQKKVVRRTAVPVLAAPAPAPAPAPVPAVKAAPRKVAAAPSGCAGRSAVSMRYMGASSRYAVRCGPQTDDHVTYSSNAAAPRRVVPTAPVPAQVPTYTAPVYTAPAAVAVTRTPGPNRVAVSAHTRVAPRHVYQEQRAARRDNITIPEGYKRVWMDGRLNPHRAHQTFAGKAQMDMIWTKTVPRKLIIRDTGQVVTHYYPGLYPPHTSYEAQRAASKGQVTYAQQTAPKATVSTRSSTVAPKPKAARSTAAAAASHRYVQAGAYSSRAQAQQAARRLSGLPVRLGSVTQGGRSYTLLLAGPFSSQSQLTSALGRVRGAGFGNAVLRK